VAATRLSAVSKAFLANPGDEGAWAGAAVEWLSDPENPESQEEVVSAAIHEAGPGAHLEAAAVAPKVRRDAKHTLRWDIGADCGTSNAAARRVQAAVLAAARHVYAPHVERREDEDGDAQDERDDDAQDDT
jgi:hypothetical protein